MHTTRVYQFTCYQKATRVFSTVPAMATSATIAAVGGRAVKHSEQEVPSCLVDGMGFYPCAPLVFVIQRCPRAYLAELGFVAAPPSASSRSTPILPRRHEPAAG